MLKWLSQFIPLAAGPLPIVFFFGVLAGEEPIDHTQKTVLREGKALHPIMERVMAIHVAEEARHISFAHEYLRKRVPDMPRRKRFRLSLHVPIIMRVLCQAIVVPPRGVLEGIRHPAFGHARRCSSGRRSRGKCCATCSPTSGCCATTPG